MSAVLYHGGAKGFRPGEVVVPHETKTFDDCPICQAGADANHLPDRVFATVSRLYAKYYASKWGGGSLYIVESIGEVELSDADPFETYHASMLRVLKVSERGVVLTMTERRRLYRLWAASDRAGDRAQEPELQVLDLRSRLALGIRL